MISLEQWFRIERVNVRWPSGHKQENDSFGAWRKVRCFRRERIILCHGCRARYVSKQTRQRQIAEAATAPAQHLAARDGRVERCIHKPNWETQALPGGSRSLT